MAGHDPVPDVEEIRPFFPALGRTQGGQPVAYFDGPGGTQVPQPVADAVCDYLIHHNGNAHWPFATSQETMAIVAGARRAMADLLGGEADEVVFGPNMSTLTFHLSRALARWCAPGDEVVVTELDHHANIDPWRALAVDFGLRVRAVRFDVSTGRLDHHDLARAISSRTRIVAVGGASNALGTVNDLERVVAAAREVGAWTFVDAVHLVPHEAVDVRALGCDFLACSAYKFYGPHIGVLYGRRELLGELDVPKLEPAPDEAPEKLETGTPVFEGIAGVGAVVDWLASLAGPQGERRTRLGRTYAAFHERGERLIDRLWKGLAAVEEVRLYGPEPGSGPRTPTLAFTIADQPSAGVAARLAAKGLYLSHGDFYARTAVRRLGKEAQGLLRAGCVAYTTEGEIDRLIAAVGRIAAGG
jgi:cysteine desulfurase family protein (TIGR01976 family)